MLDIAVVVPAILGLLGGATGAEIVRQTILLLTGRAGRRRDEVDRAWARATRAWARADRESRYRRRMEEYAHGLRRLLIDAYAADPGQIPPWPDAPTTTGPTEAQKEDR